MVSVHAQFIIFLFPPCTSCVFNMGRIVGETKEEAAIAFADWQAEKDQLETRVLMQVDGQYTPFAS